MTGKNYQERIAELMLIFENNDGRYYNSFIAARRMKAHGVLLYYFGGQAVYAGGLLH